MHQLILRDMTNVDFFRNFAEYVDPSTLPTGTNPVKTEEYYFEHDRESLDFANILDPENPNDTQNKIFHYTNPNGIQPQINSHGGVWAMTYTGSLLVLVYGDPQGVIDVQAGTDESKGRYTQNVKPMIDNGGVISEIQNYNMLSTNQHNLRLFDVNEIFEVLGMHGDGIMFKYELRIEHDTPDNISVRA